MTLSPLSSIKARLSRVRKNNMRLTGVLRNEHGAIDLASILVGVIVLGIVGGIIAAAVFAVIPWAQDSSAEQALEAVNNAEATSFALTLGKTGNGVYSTFDQLVAGVEDITIQDSDAVDAQVTATGFTAVSISPTGKVFSIDEASPAPAEYDDVAAFNLANSDMVLSGDHTSAALVIN